MKSRKGRTSDFEQAPTHTTDGRDVIRHNPDGTTDLAPGDGGAGGLLGMDPASLGRVFDARKTVVVRAPLPAYTGPDCGDTVGTHRCQREKGHTGEHADPDSGDRWDQEAPGEVHIGGDFERPDPGLDDLLASVPRATHAAMTADELREAIGDAIRSPTASQTDIIENHMRTVDLSTVFREGTTATPMTPGPDEGIDVPGFLRGILDDPPLRYPTAERVNVRISGDVAVLSVSGGGESLYISGDIPEFPALLATFDDVMANVPAGTIVGVDDRANGTALIAMRRDSVRIEVYGAYGRTPASDHDADRHTDLRPDDQVLASYLDRFLRLADALPPDLDTPEAVRVRRAVADLNRGAAERLNPVAPRTVASATDDAMQDPRVALAIHKRVGSTFFRPFVGNANRMTMSTVGGTEVATLARTGPETYAAKVLGYERPHDATLDEQKRWIVGTLKARGYVAVEK
jgi:hypothetical protein